ncbi:MAG TPA: ABC transporter permease [Puia sp.]|nr:ABC transporter permease [Puia sp.]
MFQHYLKTAVRNLLKNKGFTFLNILGLTLGLTSFLLILFYVTDELRYDRYNTNADRIFRVNTDLKSGATVSSRAITAPIIASALADNFPEVEKTVRLLRSGARIKMGEELVYEDKVAYSDAGIFGIFTLPMIEGDPATALTAPNSIVITERAAKKYFNTTRVLGQTLTLVDDDNISTIHKITGVIRNIPEQSHFNFDFLLSMVTVQISYTTQFNELFPFSTYILLKPGADYKNLEAKFPALMRKNLSFLDQMEKNGDYLRINLTPLTAIHLRSNRTNELGTNGNIQYVHILSAIALLILLIACVNFMNLSTARSANRAREVGVRKVLGSPRKYLVAQFLSESIIITLAATLLAMAAAWALLPLFNQLSGKDLTITRSMLGWLITALLVIAILVGVLAGSYPAFFLSAFQPIDVLKGRFMATGFKGGGLRSVLVVFQFSISIFLIIGTLVIYHQLHYIQNKNLGFNRNQVLVVKNVSTLGNSSLLKNEVKQLPGVLDATLSSFLPTGHRRWINYVSNHTDHIETQFWPVDANYLNTMGMTLAKGRDFSNLLSTDSSGMIVNETAAKLLGYSFDPLGKKVYYGQDEKEYHIIGVVKDFNFSSLRDNISPVVMMMMTSFERRKEGDGADALSVRVNAGNIPALVARIRRIWSTLSPHQQFEYSFMDEDFDALYRTEQRLGQLFIIFTTLAILIACLGLFGLAAYAAEQRHREISIRKILGAEISALVLLLSKDFIKLILIAILITAPLAWWGMNKWLENFAYREGIQWWAFGIAALASVAIAFLTIGYQSLKAAMVNPVEGLRAE